MIRLSSGHLNVVAQHPPEPRVVLSGQARIGRHQQRLAQGQQIGLEQQREAAAVPRPRHLDQLHTTLLTRHTRRAHVKVGLVLEEVQVPPRLFRGVVRFAAARTAIRAGERAARLEVDMDIKAFGISINLGALDPPRRQPLVLCTWRPADWQPRLPTARPPGVNLPRGGRVAGHSRGGWARNP